MAIITKTNFKNVLKVLGFAENGDIFEKKFADFDNISKSHLFIR